MAMSRMGDGSKTHSIVFVDGCIEILETLDVRQLQCQGRNTRRISLSVAFFLRGRYECRIQVAPLVRTALVVHFAMVD